MMNSNIKRIPIVRIILFLIALPFLAAGCYMFYDAFNYHQRFAHRQSLRLVASDVDFSKPGTQVIEFHQKYYIACGACDTKFFLGVPEGTFAKGSRPEVLDQFQYQGVLYNAEGEELRKFSREEEDGDPPEDYLPCKKVSEDRLYELFSFEEALDGDSDYKVVLEVTQGIPELAEVPQRLWSRGEVCPKEGLNVPICVILGIAAFVLGSIPLLIVAVISIIKRQRRKKALHADGP